MRYIPHSDMVARYRKLAVNLSARTLLVTNFKGTLQERDLTEAPNCDGFGRVRHFIRKRQSEWPNNPLPIDPACHALGLNDSTQIQAQVFQFAACSWRCWYCFVPYSLLDANLHRSAFLSASDLTDLWMQSKERPPMIDLTGGAPEIVPEWIVWMMQELQDRQLAHLTYLWSDDSLSTEYFWTCLSSAEHELISSYPNYGRVCCLKGYDEDSFSFNTRAVPELFSLQLLRLRRLLETGMDLYVYVTLTSDSTHDLVGKMSRFMDRLQECDEMLPLRVVPLRIDTFSPTATRLDEVRRTALRNQYAAEESWANEMQRRYSTETLTLPIYKVPLKSRRP